MNPNEFMNSASGCLTLIEQGAYAFVPAPLPPALPWDSELINALSKASSELGSLGGIGGLLPNPDLLIHPFANREAVLSSRIEGTQAVLRDLLLFDVDTAAEESVPDVREVANYVTALRYGWKRMEEFPVSLRFMRELHGHLMKDVRGQERTPGEFRRLQNMIGARGCTLQTARYVPPAVPEMHDALQALEIFIHGPPVLPPLILTALTHYQFEAIHPFLDGNGRVGRLLIPLLLCHLGALPRPLLYLSAYFEAHRREYYDHLLGISQRGEWRAWVLFFLHGVMEQARDAVVRSTRLLGLRESLRQRYQRNRGSSRLLHLVDLLFRFPYLNIPVIAKELNVSFPTAAGDVSRLAKDGILIEVTGRRRDRVFVAEEIVQMLE